MRTKKKFISMSLVLVIFAAAMAGCAPAAPPAPAAPAAPAAPGDAAPAAEARSPLNFRVGIMYAEGTSVAISMHHFAQIVNERAPHITVDVFTGGALGDEQGLIDGVRAGTIEMATFGGVAAQYAPAVAALEVPYIYENWEEARLVLMNEEFAAMTTAGLPEENIHFIGFVPQGFKCFSSDVPLLTPEDLSGFRMRSANIPAHVRMFESWGFNVVTLPFAELFMGLQQGVVQGQDNPMGIIIANRFYEVQNYINLTDHMLIVHKLSASKSWWDGLDAEDRQVIEQAALEALDMNWEMVMSSEEDEIRYLESQGLTVTRASEELFNWMREQHNTYALDWTLDFHDIRDAYDFARALIEANR